MGYLFRNGNTAKGEQLGATRRITGQAHRLAGSSFLYDIAFLLCLCYNNIKSNHAILLIDKDLRKDIHMLAVMGLVFTSLNVGALITFIAMAMKVSAYRSLLVTGVALMVSGLGLIAFRSWLAERSIGLRADHTHDGIVTIYILAGLFIGLIGFVVIRYITPFVHARVTMPR